jgi:DNA-binding beta-propeller fold protein YncE
VTRVTLADEPVAVAADSTGGAVYLLTAEPSTLVRFDLLTGTELARVVLPDGTMPATSLVVNPVDRAMYVTSASRNTLAVIRPDAFPS